MKSTTPSEMRKPAVTSSEKFTCPVKQMPTKLPLGRWQDEAQWLVSGLRGTANSRFPFPFSPQQSVVNKIPPLESHPWIKLLYRSSPNKKKDVFYLGGHNIFTFVYSAVSRVLWNRIQFGGRRKGKGGLGAREIVPGKTLVGGRADRYEGFGQGKPTC